MAKTHAHRATRTLLVACVCLSSLVLVLGGGEQEPKVPEQESMVLTETQQPEHVGGQGRMSRILKQLTGNKNLKTADSDAPSLPTVDGLTARFGQKQKEKKSAPKQEDVFTGEKLSEDGDSELEKLSEPDDDNEEEDNDEDDSTQKLAQKAARVSLVPNMRQEKVKDWLLHPNRAEKYPSWMGIKAAKETNKATVSPKAKAVAKRVQQTALEAAKQPTAPLPSVLKIHAGNLIVNHVPAKLPKDAVVPQKESPLQQLRSAHKAVQLATTKPAPSATQAKDAKPDDSGNGELKKIEEMSDTSDDDEEDDMEKQEAKNESDDEKDWFDKIEEDPSAAIRDSQDGENIQDFLHTEAQALKKEGKHVSTTKSVLDQQMAEQHETPVVKHITPFVEVQSSPAASATPAAAAQPQATAQVSKPEQHKAAKVGDTVVPGLHDPLAAMMAKKRTEQVTQEASQSKSAVDDIIHQLGGPEEDVEFF